ncbi:DUF1343 domain-containing protein [Psychrosphaera sp. 1_MG-2023]|uniref:exo-beta-N-acetylmuramidase NamZ family protein n=1 Tax=Psychrosphaera sp. 1_MG-2023 TaxID=3062643 RepID=UPI0026E3714D|nr:DUF1343 domain-containing protein [Psychrosphaera sp. 1_MG-2023]MDO6720305.1 DUF1343 domain-containing protein [Psychrosphaera sp. 1_MG-2023]
MWIRIFLTVLILLAASTFSVIAQHAQPPTNNDVVVGAAQLKKYLPLLKNKSVGLVVNQTSMVGDQHLVDILLSHDVNITYIFAPEHGFRGDHGAGEKVSSGKDPVTGLDIVSIYGKNKKPSAQIMDSIDVMLFDIQDVGTRFYTYISSMHYVMQAAAESSVTFIVLDRPNPNIMHVDGPVLEPAFRSFVGIHPIPLLHGLTVGELAQMIIGENWLSIEHSNTSSTTTQSELPTLDLRVIPVANYNRTTPYILPIPPSPNLPNEIAVRLYPSLCFFEATPASIGRGTPFPFQVVGHDLVSNNFLAKVKFQFTPQPIAHAAPFPKLKGKLLTGESLSSSKIQGLDLAIFIKWYQMFKENDLEFFERPEFMDKLAGTDKVRKSILAGHSIEQIKQQWQPGLQKFLADRKPYLIYL